MHLGTRGIVFNAQSLRARVRQQAIMSVAVSRGVITHPIEVVCRRMMSRYENIS